MKKCAIKGCMNPVGVKRGSKLGICEHHAKERQRKQTKKCQDEQKAGIRSPKIVPKAERPLHSIHRKRLTHRDVQRANPQTLVLLADNIICGKSWIIGGRFSLT